MAAKRCRGCGASLADMRADARWCSRACYMRAQRARRPHKARTAPRTENGIRVYLLPDELSKLAAATDHPKLRAAQRRLIGRAT